MSSSVIVTSSMLAVTVATIVAVVVTVHVSLTYMPEATLKH